jgi:single-strand DNA-binding protein
VSLNVVVLTGRLGKDPEMKYTPSGVAVTNASIAIDFGFGEDKKTSWVRLTAWKKTAETMAKYCRKGTLIGIQGYLQSKTWNDKNGEKREQMEVIVNSMQLLEPKPRSENEQSQAAKPKDAPAEQEISDDDIPF